MSMEKEKLMKSLTGPDEKLLFSKVYDRACICEKRGITTFSDFLDPIKAEKFKSLIERENIAKVFSYGGAMGCERLMLGFHNEYHALSKEDFPIKALEIIHNNRRLTHRDFLGSILGTGINREKLGDIFVFENKAIAFLNREISDSVCGALLKIGNTPISLSVISDSFLIAPFIDSAEKEIVVSSMRLDAVISAIFNLSRGKSSKMIERELAFINWECVKSSSKAVAEGDNITLRGFGRAQIVSVNSQTKNNNLRLTVKITGGRLS